MKKRDYVNNRYLSSDTEYKISKTKNKKAIPAWEIQCNTIITMSSRGKSILYLFGLPTTAPSPTQKSYVSPPINQADTILTIRVVSTRKVSRCRSRGILVAGTHQSRTECLLSVNGHPPIRSATLRSSNDVTASALVQRPTIPGSVNVSSSSTCKRSLPSRPQVI